MAIRETVVTLRVVWDDEREFGGRRQDHPADWVWQDVMQLDPVRERVELLNWSDKETENAG